MKVPEKHRATLGSLASVPADGNNGCFDIPSVIAGRKLVVIASDGMGWEHVSVSVWDGSKSRMPTWDEMCQVKDLFWDEDECVVQFHPPRSEYIDNHSFCLHLWKPVGEIIKTPPSILVGIKK